MAKKPTVKGLFEKTEPEGKPAPDDPIKARGVGLKLSEWAEIDAIAQELGKSPHYVSAYAVRYFLKTYRAGAIKLETKKTQDFPEL